MNICQDLDNYLEDAVNFGKLQAYFKLLKADAEETLGITYSLEDCIETLIQTIKDEIKEDDLN